MRKWKICGALAIILLALAAPLDSAGQGRPCAKGRVSWVMPNGLLLGFNVEMNEALLDRFETDLDWIVQDQPIHELFVEYWLPNVHSAFVRLGPEARKFKSIPREAAEGRLGKLKAALENLPYVKAVHFNGLFCLPDL